MGIRKRATAPLGCKPLDPSLFSAPTDISLLTIRIIGYTVNCHYRPCGIYQSLCTCTMTEREQITTVSNGLLIRAPAKINLSLLIAGKRPDGFHEIETVMAKITFYDEILIEPGTKAGIQVLCQGPQWAPPGQDNLIYRAAEMLMDGAGLRSDVRLTLA